MYIYMVTLALPSLVCAYLSTPHGSGSWSSRAPAARFRCCQDAVPQVGTRMLRIQRGGGLCA